MNHFTTLCRSRRQYYRHSRHSQRETHKSRHTSRSSSRSSSRNRSHNTCTRRQRRSPTPHHIDTITTTQDFIASNSDTKDGSTQLKQVKSRHPTPLPTNVFSLITYSNTEDPEDTASEASITIHSQDEDSTDYNVISPPRTYYILMSPPSTCQTMLTRPPCITATNATQDQNSTADSELPVSDTETESSYTLQMENTNFSSLQDHIVHLPRPPYSPRPTNQHK